ncbi:MAG: diacylglycerol kinase family protein [Oscillospiraceae bacterium]
MRRFLKGFVWAGRGVVFCLRERNFRCHLCFAAFVSWFAARFYDLSRAEWAVLLLTFGAVLSLEAVNTAVERLCDRVSPEKNKLVGMAKDIAAGAVLLMALGAVGVGIALFWDTERFAAMGEWFLGAWYRIPAFAAAFAAGVCFVLLPEKKRAPEEINRRGE